MTAAPQLTQAENFLTLLTGPEAGVAYKLVGQSITIGRAPENDVVLQDVKSSRTHAKIELREGQYWIKDLGSQNGININGQDVRESALNPGDKITVGTTIMRFGPNAKLALVGAPAMPLAGTSTGLSATGQSQAGQWMPPPVPKNSGGYGDEKKKNTYLAIAGVVVIGIAVAMSQSSNDNKKKKGALQDEAHLDQEIESNAQLNEQRQQEIMSKGKDTDQYRNAQSFYQRGFREFRENNYGRAIQFFETSLTLYPNHPLSKRYLERSRLKLNEIITKSLEQGEKNFQAQKYAAAFSDYRTVMQLTNDPSNKSFQLAKKRIEAIKLIQLNSK